MRYEFIENLADSWKFASVRLAAIFSILAGVFAGNPELLLGLIQFLPEGRFKILGVALVTATVFIIPVLTRVIKRKENPVDNVTKPVDPLAPLPEVTDGPSA